MKKIYQDMSVTGSECFIQWDKVEEGRGGKV